MNDYIYLWVDQYRFIDEINGENKYLFNNFGISLSSKYKVHIENEAASPLAIHIDDSESKILYEPAEEGYFYSKCISDLKVIVGKNGAGKSSIIELLKDIIAGNIHDGNLRFCLVFIDESNSLKYFAKNVDIQSIVYNNLTIDPRRASVKSLSNKVIFYTATFNDEWHLNQPDGEHKNIINLGTKFLLKQDVETYNNNPRRYANSNLFSTHAILESKRQINFVSNSINEDNFINDDNPLKDIFCFPDKIIFNFSNGLIKNGLHELTSLIDVKRPEERTRLERKWQIIFYRAQEIHLKIQFSLLIAIFLKYKDFNLKNSKYRINIDDFYLGISIRGTAYNELLDLICKKLKLYLDNQYSIHLEEKLYRLLIPHQRITSEGTYFEFSINREKDEITELLDTLERVGSPTLLLEYRWNRPMSSGESCYLRLFSRLYDAILDLKKFEAITSLHVPILIDEVDLYLHPEWQRTWFYRFIKGIELMQSKTGIELKLQLIMTTHSPFMLTDFISDNIARISRNGLYNKSEQNITDNYMVGNIYNILKDGFFLEGTMGLFIENKLKDILRHPNQLSEKDKFAINHIGDALIKSLVLRKVGR